MNGPEKLQAFLTRLGKPMAQIARMTGISETRLSEFKRGVPRNSAGMFPLSISQGSKFCRGSAA